MNRSDSNSLLIVKERPKIHEPKSKLLKQAQVAPEADDTLGT